MSNILNIIIVKTNLEAEDIELILKSIMQLKTLKALTLGKKIFSSMTCAKLSLIGGNNIGNKTELIRELLQTNRNPLRVLSLMRCKIEDEGGKIILEGLKQNSTLRTLGLSKKPILIPINCIFIGIYRTE